MRNHAKRNAMQCKAARRRAATSRPDHHRGPVTPEHEREPLSARIFRRKNTTRGSPKPDPPDLSRGCVGASA
eukprot:9138260-Pyramimonas_sp.AAC.1